MTYPSVADLIDDAIAMLACKMYRGMSKGLSRRCNVRKVSEALDALGGLRDGKPPCYDDECVALFYLTWYQPRQINFVASICGADDDNAPKYPTRLLVIDVNCGAFATLIGTVAHYAMRGIDASIVVHGIDPSNTMKTMGKELVDTLCLLSCSEYDGELAAFHRILSHSSICCYESLDDYLTSPNRKDVRRYDDHFVRLTAIHAVYEQNAKEMREHLDELKNDDFGSKV